MPTGTTLEQMRNSMGLQQKSRHRPQWRVKRANERFSWLMDGNRAVGLLDERDEVFELRCHGPRSQCPPAVVPRYYHTVTYTGVRIMYTWRLGGRTGKRTSSTVKTRVTANAVLISCEQRWEDGTVSLCTIRLRHDPVWDAYVADCRAVLDMRRITTALEYCNVLPAAIGDSRPGQERLPYTYWKHPDGFKKMLKNPLWFTSVGAQDLTGEKHIEQGGFIGFGPDARFNPVVEIVSSDPETGATTCDNLQDEHVMVFPAEGRHAAATGWFHVEAKYRLFSIPPAMAKRIVAEAADMNTGAMLAWKFQYPPTPELPMDLTRVELPGTLFYGKSDWSKPIPWDKPYNGQLWTASPDPAAAIHYDRKVGRRKPGSIRLRLDGDPIVFSPGSGHTLHLNPGRTYRFSAWVRTQGRAKGFIEAAEVLHCCGDRLFHRSPEVPPGSDWTRVEVDIKGQKDEVPFAMLRIGAEGHGTVWFTEPAFERI